MSKLSACGGLHDQNPSLFIILWWFQKVHLRKPPLFVPDLKQGGAFLSALSSETGDLGGFCPENWTGNAFGEGESAFLREALFTSVGKSKSDVPSVRPSVRKIITFCEADIGGVVRCLTTVGFWKPDFLEVEKKWSLCTYIHGKCSQLWIHFWAPFLNSWKNMFLTWIASVDKKVEESRRLGVVVSGKFA